MSTKQFHREFAVLRPTESVPARARSLALEANGLPVWNRLAPNFQHIQAAAWQWEQAVEAIALNLCAVRNGTRCVALAKTSPGHRKEMWRGEWHISLRTVAPGIGRAGVRVADGRGEELDERALRPGAGARNQDRVYGFRKELLAWGRCR